MGSCIRTWSHPLCICAPRTAAGPKDLLVFAGLSFKEGLLNYRYGWHGSLCSRCWRFLRDTGGGLSPQLLRLGAAERLKGQTPIASQWSLTLKFYCQVPSRAIVQAPSRSSLYPANLTEEWKGTLTRRIMQVDSMSYINQAERSQATECT